ncbi:ricin-type beta-trefoil lectin domain protein [Dactylosporangium sucinum]|uniref:Ricin B lectin domain-containing protein n=1 Tax=Dactylosporangium sucinum TaxID=1424081 RepID=A0A917TXX9_9ACTN|nr:RICIN domain-containing protein [Dactylosporangium sucinum]GGM41635.1 hypothetical protein GCM10007977_048860 [Dactylosporangium sucinum]
MIQDILGRLRRRDDGSLPLAMLLTLVGTSLSTLMVPVVIQQVRDTASTVRRAQALHAAQAGIDVVVGIIRSTDGNRNKLCDIPLDFEGAVADGIGRYWVTVELLNEGAPVADCRSKAPTSALIKSKGTNVLPGERVMDVPDPLARKLRATYKFRFTNANVEGGLVKFLGGAYCLDAGSSSPAVGTNVTTQPCSTGSSRQTFTYTKYLTLQLVSSKTPMCLDSGAGPVAGTLIQFRPCGSPTVPYHQQWNLNDGSSFQSTDSSGLKLGSLCFHAKQASTSGAFVELVNCGGSDNTRTFAPEASVGAGAAGPPAQLVNFKQFGRCVDVTNFDVTLNFLIVWPCKQAPNQANVGWNQRFTIPATADGKTGHASGQISTYDSSKTKKTVCLTTADPEKFVTMQACPAPTTASAEWTVYYQEQTYGASYVILDSKGYCLTPTDLDARPLLDNNIFKGSTTVSKLTVAPCNGSKLQKWNAPANTEDPSPLKDIGED